MLTEFSRAHFKDIFVGHCRALSVYVTNLMHMHGLYYVTASDTYFFSYFGIQKDGRTGVYSLQGQGNKRRNR